MQFAYDALGRTQSITYPDGEVVNYDYDRGGNLRHVASAARTYVDEIHYDHFGRRRRVRNGNGTESVFTCDAVMQRLSQQDTTTDLGATALQSLRYQYDQTGLINGIENAITTGPMRGYSLRKFEYDENDQLVSASGQLNDVSGSQRRFSLNMDYDALGCITRMNQVDEVLPSGGGSPTPVAATTRDNAYSDGGARVHAAPQIGSDQFWYDANGNQYFKQNTVSGSWRYLTWDEEDRLSYAFTPSTTTGFQYDAGGARTHKTDYSETTLHPSAYVTIRNGTEVTEHIWAGGPSTGAASADEICRSGGFAAACDAGHAPIVARPGTTALPTMTGQPSGNVSPVGSSANEWNVDRAQRVIAAACGNRNECENPAVSYPSFALSVVLNGVAVPTRRGGTFDFPVPPASDVWRAAGRPRPSAIVPVEERFVTQLLDAARNVVASILWHASYQIFGFTPSA